MNQFIPSNQQPINVFLAHNSFDRPHVKRIHNKLNDLEIRTWLDQVDLKPGQLFQDQIQKAISRANSVAVFIGQKGLGRWQAMELRIIVSNFVDRECPVIPVLLPGVTQIPNNLSFLAEFHRVEFRDINDPQALEELVAGIRQCDLEPITIKRKPIEIFRDQLLITLINLFQNISLLLKYKISLFLVLLFILAEVIVITNRSYLESIRDSFTSEKPVISFSTKEPLEYKITKKGEDPVDSIYKNNSELSKLWTGSNKVTIAVSVPIGSSKKTNNSNPLPLIALEMLRGVAQAQEMVNHSSNKFNFKLEVGIADDKNDSTFAEKVASYIAKDNRRIWAVVGHNSSESSLAASKVYTTQELTMISPTSDAPSLFKLSPYIFTTMSDNGYIAKELGKYIINNITIRENQKSRIVLVCSNTKSQASEGLRRNLFVQIYSDPNIKEPNIQCDFNEIQSNNNNEEKISNIVDKSLNEKIDAIVLLPSVNDIETSVELAKEIATRKRTIPLIGSPTLAMHNVIKKGGTNIEGLIVGVPWAWDDKKNSDPDSFEYKANQMWKAPVNWRSAMSYDATMAIVEGVKKLEQYSLWGKEISEKRKKLANALNDEKFNFKGATGEVSFQKIRNSGITLLNVVPVPNIGLKFSKFQYREDQRPEDCK